MEVQYAFPSINPQLLTYAQLIEYYNFAKWKETNNEHYPMMRKNKLDKRREDARIMLKKYHINIEEPKLDENVKNILKQFFGYKDK